MKMGSFKLTKYKAIRNKATTKTIQQSTCLNEDCVKASSWNNSSESEEDLNQQMNKGSLKVIGIHEYTFVKRSCHTWPALILALMPPFLLITAILSFFFSLTVSRGARCDDHIRSGEHNCGSSACCERKWIKQ